MRSRSQPPVTIFAITLSFLRICWWNFPYSLPFPWHNYSISFHRHTTITYCVVRGQWPISNAKHSSCSTFIIIYMILTRKKPEYCSTCDLSLSLRWLFRNFNRCVISRHFAHFRFPAVSKKRSVDMAIVWNWSTHPKQRHHHVKL